MAPKARTLRSKEWSCDELAESHENMMDVKTEAETNEELQRKVKDYETLETF